MAHSSSSSEETLRGFRSRQLLPVSVLACLLLATVLWTAVGPVSLPERAFHAGPDNASPPSPYLILDLTGRRISVVMAGVVLRQYPLQEYADTADLLEASEAWVNPPDSGRTIRRVFLLSAADVIAPTELSVIAEEFRLKEDLVQRYIPARMVLVTNDGLALRIETDVEEAHANICPRVSEAANRLWRTVTGKETLELSLNSNDAASLYATALAAPRIITK